MATTNRTVAFAVKSLEEGEQLWINIRTQLGFLMNVIVLSL